MSDRNDAHTATEQADEAGRAGQAEPDPSPEVAAFRDLLAGRWVGYAVHAAAQLDLAGALAEGPRSAAELAATVGADPVALGRLLRALVTVGLCRHGGGDEVYELTPMGTLLRSDSPTSFRDQVLLTGGERAMRSWTQFAECVRTGDTASKLLDGIDDPFAWFAANPEAQRNFDAAMAEGTGQLAPAIAQAYDFTGVGSIVDVGGGYGTLLPPILSSYPDMTGVVFDRAHCRQGAEQRIEQLQLTERCRFVAGDFFADPVPAGADAYILKSVIHDWDDDRSAAVFEACRRAMLDSSRLLTVEVVVPDRLERSPEHRQMVWADLNMLVNTGGLERTERQYGELLGAAGLRISRIVPTRTPNRMSVIEALPT